MKYRVRQHLVGPYGEEFAKVKELQGELGSDLYDIHGREIFAGDEVVFVGDGDAYKVTYSAGAFRVDGHPMCNYTLDQFEIIGGNKNE